MWLFLVSKHHKCLVHLFLQGSNIWIHQDSMCWFDTIWFMNMRWVAWDSFVTVRSLACVLTFSAAWQWVDFSLRWLQGLIVTVWNPPSGARPLAWAVTCRSSAHAVMCLHEWNREWNRDLIVSRSVTSHRIISHVSHSFQGRLSIIEASSNKRCVFHCFLGLNWLESYESWYLELEL